jgi:hypothetical protein
MNQNRIFGRFLEPVERISEVLFGLIMVLSFTGSLSIAAERTEVTTMLIGALGCNLAWGIIDGVLYLMGTLAEKGRGVLTLRAVRAATDPAHAERVIAEALPPVVAELLSPAELGSLRERLLRRTDLPNRARLSRQDWLAALGVFAWVFLATFPVAIPFIFMTDADLALRVSNGVAVTMLFVAGYGYGRCIGRAPWAIAAAMVLLGMALVGLTIALGG